MQNRCAPTTTQLFVYNEKTTFKDWGITVDQSTARYALRLNAWDGAKLPPLYQIANPPNMLPTEPLTGTNVSLCSCGQADNRTRDSSTPSVDLRRRLLVPRRWVSRPSLLVLVVRLRWLQCLPSLPYSSCASLDRLSGLDCVPVCNDGQCTIDFEFVRARVVSHQREGGVLTFASINCANATLVQSLES